MIKKTLILSAVGTLLTISAVHAQRDQIRIVGSSTVYPFATKVAEMFGNTTGFKTPVVESTGSGGGFKLFCAGVGVRHPDMTTASRAIKESEVEICRSNGVTDVTEVKIGYDGIVLASSRKAPRMSLTRQQLFLALAKQVPSGSDGLEPNPYSHWNQIDARLPAQEIEVLGPPPTSGTRDAFVELAMEGGCKSWDWIKDLKKSAPDRYKAICHTVREDGRYVEAGENDNLIVQKLEAEPDAFGIFGFSFLDQNGDRLQGSVIDGIEPTFELIADGSYPVSRPLFFYVKKAHVGVIPGIDEYVREFTSDRSWGEEGYLADSGLIPMAASERAEIASQARRMVNNIGRPAS